MKIFDLPSIFRYFLPDAGCAINATQPLPIKGKATSDRVVVIYGVKVEVQWEYSGWLPEEVKYFAIEAPAGYYVYSPFNDVQLKGNFMLSRPGLGKAYIGETLFLKSSWQP